MTTDPGESHLSRISTTWTLVFQAHRGSLPARQVAQAAVLERLQNAIFRYVLSVLGDQQAAEDLCQDFAYRFVRGDFHRARPEGGRFRDFVKRAVINLIRDWRRRRQAGPRLVPFDDALQGGVASSVPDGKETFEMHWKTELLERAWKRLEQLEEEGGGWFYTLLRHRAEHPGQSTEEMASALAARLNRTLKADNVRKTLQRAREKFAGLLVEEVALALETATPEELRDELTELGLLSYCQPALAPLGL